MKTINTKPGAWICVNENERQTRGRKKSYQPGSKIYMNDGEEFEIELFNPSTDNVKAVIEIDGKAIMDGGLVLRSGQRVYLECFPDSKKKFTFKTYEVENSNEAKQAISNNGKVTVKFYREKKYYNFDWNPNWKTTYYNTYTNYTGGTNPRDIVFGTTTAGSSFNATKSALTNLSDGFSEAEATMDTLSYFSNTIETGQVDGGDHSDQKFDSVDMDFDSWVLSSYSFQLLPMSQKPADVKQFKVTKKKKTVVSKADELLKLKELLESELITEDEFEQLKSEII